MAEELNEGAAAPATDDLRSTITAAIERQRTATAEPAAAADEPAQTEAAPAEGEGTGRVRDEHGRFAPQDKPAEPKEAKPADPAAQTQPKAEAAPDASQAEQSTHRPPPGWSPKSKAVFDNLPNEVKIDIAKRESEVNQGFAKLAEYKPIERFVDMARQSGTTLETALAAYTNIENTFRRDPIEGIEAACSNMNINPRVVFLEMARRYGIAIPTEQQTPASDAAAQQQPQQMQLPRALVEKLTGLESTVTQLQRERQASEMNATTQNVEAFFNDPKNKYANNVANVMASLINMAKQNGEKINLPTIYEQACWLHPEVKEVLINERLATNPAVSNSAKAQAAAADQARQAAKAVTGAPSRGSPPGSAPPANESVRDTITRAIAQQRGA